MPKEFDITGHMDLVSRARDAFLEDTSYAIAIAKPAGALVARRKEREVANLDLDDV